MVWFIVLIVEYCDFVYGVCVIVKFVVVFLVCEVVELDEVCVYVYGIVMFFEDGWFGYDVEYLCGDEVIVDVLC